MSNGHGQTPAKSPPTARRAPAQGFLPGLLGLPSVPLPSPDLARIAAAWHAERAYQRAICRYRENDRQADYAALRVFAKYTQSTRKASR